MQYVDQIKANKRRDNLRATKKKEVIPYSKIHNFIEWLCEQTEGKNYCGVYGVPRGGIFFAMLYSYKRNLPMLQAPCANCLIIDDDAGLGHTIAPYLRRGYDVAVMFSRKECKEQATYIFDYYNNYDEDVFLVFPWGE